MIVVCDAANLYYAAHCFTRVSRFRTITRGRKCTSDLYLQDNSTKFAEKSESKFSKLIVDYNQRFFISYYNKFCM